MAERALLAALGGNCHSAMAVLTRHDGGHASPCSAALFSPDGAERVDGEASFAAGDAEGPARLADALLARATPAIAVHFAGNRPPP